MNPKAIDDMGMAMADVYAAVTDRILINLAHHFPYVQTGQHMGSWEYQTMMLAQMGKVEKETIAIIAQSLGGADEALKQALETAILQGLKNEEPKLRQAAMNGLLQPHGYVPELDPSQLQAFTSYYRQSADKLNLVNTVMLDSTKQAYQATVADVAQKIANTQGILNAAAGEVITGVSSWNGAMHSAVQKMVANGITGFIDHAGHKWSPEAYVAMDIKTTMFNTARAAVWERSEQYGSDLYQVSSHNGARPLCYPWQGKVISTSGRTGVTHDLDGNEVVIHSQDEIESFRYGGGLFGINCQHYPMTFIPEFSTLKGEPQDQATNDKQYAETQQQRALERRLREEKRDLEVMKAQGAPAEQIKAQREKVRSASADIDEFCDKTGLPRRRNREAAPVRAEWSTPNGNVTRYNGEYIATDAVPPPKAIQPTPTIPIIPTTPPSPQVESELVKTVLPQWNITKVPLTKWSKTPTTDDIIKSLGGGDKTRGSCASLSFAYAGNRAGYEVHDFRGGESWTFFSRSGHIKQISQFKGVTSYIVSSNDDFKAVGELVKNVIEGKEYILSTGKHAAIIRKTGGVYEYLELQTETHNGFHVLNNAKLQGRFGCKHSHTFAGQKMNLTNVLIDVDSLKESPDFIEALQYINTNVGSELKGVGGGAK